MHAPDGFLTVGTAVATGALSTGAVGVALHQSREQLADRQVPLAGMAAAFVFAAQMVNFPVAGGTSGHLLGGALAAVLLGPSVGAVVVTVVVVLQALMFADGGVFALGYNVLNMAIVTAFGGWAAFRLARRVLPAPAAGVAGAAGIGGFASVVLSSMAFSVEWLFGASFPVPFDTVFGAMVGVHVLIGIGEGVITAMVVGAVLQARPDLVHGARDLDRAAVAERRVPMRAFAIGALLATLTTAAVISQFASGSPDGLERVAEDTGFAEVAEDHPFADFLFADYATQGIGDERVSLAVAGVAGSAVTLAVGLGLFAAVRGSRRPVAVADARGR